MKNPFRKRWRILHNTSRKYSAYRVEAWSMEWPWFWEVRNNFDTIDDAKRYIESLRAIQQAKTVVVWRSE